MARMTVKGTDEYALKLSKLGKNGEAVAGKAIYAAAGIVADAVKANIKSLSAVKDIENIKAYREGTKSHLSIKQKEGLINSFGISKLSDDNGYYNVKLGFDGYNAIKTKKYPKGQPNRLIARVTESGSTYMDKTPFMRTAVNATRKNAVDEMQKVIDEESKKIMD